MRYVVLFLIYLGILKRLPACSFIACLQRAACEEAHDALPERAARRRTGRRASPVLGRRVLGRRALGMRVAPGVTPYRSSSMSIISRTVSSSCMRSSENCRASADLRRSSGCIFLSVPFIGHHVFDSANTFAIGRKGGLSPGFATRC